MRSWASSTVFAAGRRGSLVRTGIAVVLLGAVLWVLPVRRPGEDAGHHTHAARPLDPFEKAGVSELTEGQRAPAFTLATLDGGRASLADHRDKLVVLNFWATWCQPCTLEMPTLEALWRQYQSRGLVVLGVSMDRGAPRPLLDPYVSRLGLTFPILLDADLTASQAWRVSSLPATFVVRPGGNAVALAFGAREWNSAEMRAVLEGLLPAK